MVPLVEHHFLVDTLCHIGYHLVYHEHHVYYHPVSSSQRAGPLGAALRTMAYWSR